MLRKSKSERAFWALSYLGFAQALTSAVQTLDITTYSSHYFKSNTAKRLPNWRVRGQCDDGKLRAIAKIKGFGAQTGHKSYDYSEWGSIKILHCSKY